MSNSIIESSFDPEIARTEGIKNLLAKYGSTHQARIEQGVQQAVELWQATDGTTADFLAFATTHFLSENRDLDLMFTRLETAFEALSGHMNDIIVAWRFPMDVDIGPSLPLDNLLAQYSPFAHVNEDLYRSKVGFAVLLNYPRSTLQERLTHGKNWTRKQWAIARIVNGFSERVPADVQQTATEAISAATVYVNNLNFHLDRLLTQNKKRIFPVGLRLISHWGIRDEIKANYTNNGFEKQKLLETLLESVVQQKVPEIVINSTKYDWTVETGEVYPMGETTTVDATPEPNTRYQKILDVFHGQQAIDAIVRRYPTFIERVFEQSREMPEQRVVTLLENLIKSPVMKQVGQLIQQRLARPLEPFDIWYAGFKPNMAFSEAELDNKTRKRYPTVQAFEADLPRIFTELGFQPEINRLLSESICVDASRGVGHAFGIARRDAQARLRTRVGKEGMDYKGYNIAVHELGHNVEQVFSTKLVDHITMAGVPNSSFTEAIAFIFQKRDFPLLGIAADTISDENHHLGVLDKFWNTVEIGAVSLVEMQMWHWLYENPDATAQALRDQTIQIAQKIWNRTFGPIIGPKDSSLLAVYSHYLNYPLYMSNYALGELIMFQIEQHINSANLAIEVERMCKIGNVTPDHWMEEAVGQTISIDPLITATKESLTHFS